MKRISGFVPFIVWTLFLSGNAAFSQEDKSGCTDPDLFTRVSGFYLNNCTMKEFDVHNFVDPVTKKQASVEGRLNFYYYKVKTEFRGQKSMLQIARNYSNAIEKIGGSAYMKDKTGGGNTYMKIAKGGRNIWASIEQDNWKGNTYYLYILEEEPMKQDVVADAGGMAEGLSTTGHVAVYGIYFDTDKSDIKPESGPALAEIAKLLTGNPKLRVLVVGHTDNVGGFDYNMKLSKARADAVVQALSKDYKVNPQQMKAFGAGQLAPVAPNNSEEGRARNRRVELVEQ